MDKTIYHQSKGRRYSKYLLLTLILCSFLSSCYRNNSEVRILFVGDILLSRNVRTEFTTRNTFPWDTLQSQFKSADLIIGNLEGAVGKINNKLIANHPSPVFDIDSTHISMLSKAGFNIITVENNHSFDLGAQGKINTIKALQRCNITPVFIDNSPQFFTVKNIVFSIVSLNTVLGRDSSKNQIPSIEIQQKMRLARIMNIYSNKTCS